jgi:hypothetical protein
MLDVHSQDASKMLAADDEQLVKTLSAHGTDPPLGVGVRVGRLHRCEDDLGASRAPHVVERPGELGVPVTDQELARGGLVVEDADEVAGLLRNPEARGMVGDATKVYPPTAQFVKNSTYNRRRKTVSTVKKSQARMPVACRRRNDRQLVAARRGTGSRPWAHSTRRIELADTRTPRRSNSPWIRW